MKRQNFCSTRPLRARRRASSKVEGLAIRPELDAVIGNGSARRVLPQSQPPMEFDPPLRPGSALGWPVLPYGADMDRWRIGDLVMTDEDLLGLATRRGVRPVSERVQ